MGLYRCAFTGHRPQQFPFGFDEEYPDCNRIKNALSNHIQTLYQQGVRQFYTGCAQGVDLWGGEVILELQNTLPDLELFCVIPYEDQAARWSADYRDRYYTMLSHCTRDILLQRQYTPGCLVQRNHYLVEHTDMLLAVYDRENHENSGTGQTVRMAIACKKRVVVIDPMSGRIIGIPLACNNTLPDGEAE